MSVTLNTQLGELMFSSQIPDIDLSTSDDNEAVVSIVSGGTTVFSAIHIPYQRNIVVHELPKSQILSTKKRPLIVQYNT